MKRMTNRHRAFRRHASQAEMRANPASDRQTGNVQRRFSRGSALLGSLLAAGTALVALAATPANASPTAPSITALPVATAGPVVDTAQPATWNFVQADVPGGQARGNDGTGIVVAVVDGFVDATHPDFSGPAGPDGTPGPTRVLPGADCRSGVCIPGSASEDNCGHGTHVAGTIAGTTYGVAPRALIMPVTVLAQDVNGACSGSPSAVAAAIVWASDHGAQIINVSLGDTSGPALLQGSAVTAAVHAAATAGALVVTAAGNNGNPIGAPNYGTDALVVAATGPDGQVAPYSNRGPNVVLAAPGGDAGAQPCAASDCIASTWLDDGFALLSGTSMAAPVVSGAAALMLAANSGLTRFDLTAALTRTSVPIKGTTRTALVDVAAAVDEIAPSSTHPSTPPSGAVPTPPKLVVPASRPPAAATPAAQASDSVGHHDGPSGPWQIALLLVISMGIACGAVILGRTD
jgi:serine protease